MKKGILLTIMGVNNVGKTTQQDILEKKLKQDALAYTSLKYPIYKLEPTGPEIFSCLKQGNPEKISPLKLQQLCVQNRIDFEKELINLLETNDVVIAEMYSGTGIAFGMGDGLDKDYLIDLNKDLLKPDLSILLDGERFLESREKGHYFEEDDEKSNRIRHIHLELAKDFGWHIINANQPQEVVHDQIWQKISQTLNL